MSDKKSSRRVSRSILSAQQSTDLLNGVPWHLAGKPKSEWPFLEREHQRKLQREEKLLKEAQREVNIKILIAVVVVALLFYFLT